MNKDLSFITNEGNQTLQQRFLTLIKDTAFFDCLVGYFYASGFHAIVTALENTAQIRILIGIKTERRLLDLLTAANTQHDCSHAEAKQSIEGLIKQEMEQSEDNNDVETGVRKFLEWIKSNKLKIKAYPSKNLHAKLYIMTFTEGDRDLGRVITGSSNFTRSGLVDNLEFNVELKNSSDYQFAKDKFEELWLDAVDVSENYVQTIEANTWLNQNITPYQLYLKFLYEYFQDELKPLEDPQNIYIPEKYKRLEYQQQAVLNAKKILLQYGGVFISDVVGLGKTYICALLTDQLDGRTLVIAPPMLLRKSNPGSWKNVFSDFRISVDYESLGKLEQQLKQGVDKYKNIIIDEAHRFRTDTTQLYENIAKICRGKRVILVTATPYHNTPKDILSLLGLFQNTKQSIIPNLPDLESFFNHLSAKLKRLDRKQNYKKYSEIVTENSKEIRDKVLKYLMVRRTRTEIEQYFSEDLKRRGISFPKVAKPHPFYYQLNPAEDQIFNQTIELITTEFNYTRYTPMLYYHDPLNSLEQQSQKNMKGFMKTLLVKRLESSFFAFRKSVDRFIRSYEQFLKALHTGYVYTSKKHSYKLFELLENDDDDAIEDLINQDKVTQYTRQEFTDNLNTDLEDDLKILNRIQQLWQPITRDPKLLSFQHELATNPILKNNHLIIFTESKETATYLHQQLEQQYPDQVLLFSGDSDESTRDKVIQSFDPRSPHKQHQYRILISTDVLSEGVNLHRSNVVINYDIPWNPTRMMQRVGRINRLDTTFKTIHTFNFFPTTQANDLIKLKEAARLKIHAFLSLLGGDAELLTAGEPIDSHALFDRLISKKTLEGEGDDTEDTEDSEDSEDSELKYLHAILTIRDQDPALFEQIKRLPKKARTAKQHSAYQGSLISYFRQDQVQKFFIADDQPTAEELDFITAASLLESTPDDSRHPLPASFYDRLNKNKRAFRIATTAGLIQPKPKGGTNAQHIQKLLRATLNNTQPLTDDQEDYLKQVFRQLQAGALTKRTTNSTWQALKQLEHERTNPLRVLAVLQRHIPEQLLQAHTARPPSAMRGKREVILSLYLVGQ